MNTVYIISGIGGMTGSELAMQLSKRTDCTIIGFDNGFNCNIEYRKKQFSKKLNIEAFLGSQYDITNENFMNKLEKVINENKISYNQVIVINCAAVVHTKHFYEVNDTFDTNVIAMRNILNIAINVGASIFINCSTSEVYSAQSWVEGGVREDDILSLYTAEHSQRTSYAMGKLMTEFFLRDVVNKGYIKGASLRFANVYANDEESTEHIIPKLVYGALRQEQIILCKNAKHTYRTFLHNYDSCQAVIHLIDHPEVLDGSAFNVGTTVEYSIPELVNIIEIELGKDINIEYSNPARKSDPPRRLLNCNKLMKTGWSPFMTLREGLKEVIKYASEIVEEEHNSSK